MSEEKPRQKISTSRTLEHKLDGSPYFKLVRQIQERNIDGIWQYRKELETVTEKTPLEIGLFKEKEITVAFPRSATNDKTLLSMFAWFTQKLKVSVDQSRQFKHVWLSLTNGKIFIQYLGFNGRYSGLCTKADLNGKEECLTIQKIGKPRRISAERLDAMKHSGEISMVFANEKLGEIRLDPKPE